ncbi:glycosyltransferase family 4 protein [Paenibacillus stellifer]|uniref:glycosyltransferase family 4 protein n=1 Tax=Paenibacillus stellifer TaxID=169760 RepID=UPI001FE07558|nr:glycosyltransferase family 4 protein [Paenibacillus stellifer]
MVFHACTIIMASRISEARELSDSLKRVYPDSELWVLLLDGEEVINYGGEARLHVLNMQQIGVARPQTLAFRFSMSQLTAVLQPLLIDYLLSVRQLDNILYIDGCLRISGSLPELMDSMNRDSAVYASRSADDLFPLIGITSQAQGRKALAKWRSRIENRVLNDSSEPSMKVEEIHKLLVDSDILNKISLSPGRISQVASTLTYRNPATPYVEPDLYKWSRFSNGFPIPDVFRLIYGSIDPHGSRFINPFDSNSPEEFLRWLKSPVSMKTSVPNLLYEIYWLREDVRMVYPDPLGQDEAAFTEWGTNNTQTEYGIASDFFKCPFGSLEWALAPVHPGTVLPNLVYEIYRTRPDLQSVFHDPLGQDAVHLLKWAQFRIPAEFSPNFEWLPEYIGNTKETPSDPQALLAWALAPVNPQVHLPRMVYEMVQKRPDLQQAFPDPLGKDEVRLLKWAQVHLQLHHPEERRIHERFQLSGTSKPFYRHSRFPFISLDSGRERGINLIGYTRTENGVGEASRMAARAIQAAGIPFGMIHIPLNGAQSEDRSWSHMEITDSRYSTNLMYINADSVTGVYHRLGWNFFAGNTNIALWHWELPEFPDTWSSCFEMLDEVWAPSRFVQQAIQEISPIPVIRMPHAVNVEVPQWSGRSYFGLPVGKFLFLSMYDTWSFQERKNPQAAIEAFRKAFPEPDSNAGLVLKVNNANSMPEQLEQLKRSLAGIPNIYLIEISLTRPEINALIHSVDCFVSLHRSEGFGIVLAEAMYLGKPVIGTLWSGNTDFMNAGNSCGVSYQLVELDESYGPYSKGQRWAEPDVEQAAYFMNRLVSDAEWRNKIAAKGQHTIRTEFSPLKVGAMMKKRLEKLKRL